MRDVSSHLRRVLLLGAAGSLMLFAPAAGQQDDDAARRVLEAAAEAMGGLEMLQGLDNIVLTGFGQRYNTNGNLSPDPNSPPKWIAVADAERTFDIQGRRALNQERQSRMFPFAASFGHSWNRSNTLQTGITIMDHPLPALLEALAPETELGAVRIEDGLAVVDFTIEGGRNVSMAIDQRTNLPAWTRWIAGDVQFGDVTYTAHFTGYVPYDGVQLPLGLMNKMDWRDQTTLMFQVDSYRVNAGELPEFPEPAAPGGPGGAPVPEPVVTELAPGVWDVRLPGAQSTPEQVNGNGGAVIEFDDHLVIFEPHGSEAQFFARVDAANQLVEGKEVEAVIVSHHHQDHAAAIRGAVARGLTIIAEAGNEELYREMASRPAIHFPDTLARDPQPFKFMPVEGTLVLEDDTQRLEVHHVIGHAHMSNAVFAYLPEERIMMEGDLGDVNWEWHWWGGAFRANIDHYGIDPERNVPVHGQVLTIEGTLAQVDEQIAAAQASCERNLEAGIYFFGCPVQYTSSGHVRD